MSNKKVIQRNTKNIGLHSKGDNNGYDDNGNLVDGYQHGDALHVDNEVTKELDPLFKTVAKNIVETYNPKTVLELGCGNGQLSYEIRKLNPDILTVTADANRDLLDNDTFKMLDENHFPVRTDEEFSFTYEDSKDRIEFDVIVSLEHFEHIPTDNVDQLMYNIHNHSKEGTQLMFTAAKWEYEEEGREHIHCTVKPYLWWVNLIEQFRFYPRNPDIDSYPEPFLIGRCMNGTTSEIFARRTENRRTEYKWSTGPDTEWYDIKGTKYVYSSNEFRKAILARDGIVG